MRKVTLRGLLAHKLRLVAAALSVVLGVALMAGTLVLTDTVGRTFDDLYATVGAGTDAVVRSRQVVPLPQGGEQRAPVDAALLDAVRATPGVAVAEGTVSGYAQLVGHDGRAIGNPGQGAPTLGFNWSQDPRLSSFTLVEGHAPTGPDEVVIDKASADKGRLAVGDPVRILTRSAPRDLHVSGIVRFGTADSPLGASIALFDTATAQALLGTPGRFDNVAVVAAEGVGQDEVVASLQGRVPAGDEAITGAQAVAEQQDAVHKNLAFFSAFLLTFALIALFVGSFIIYNSFAITVAQRTRELALLRALGASRRQVRTAVLAESITVGTLASALGVVAGLGMASVLKGILGSLGFDIPATGTVITPSTLLTAFLAGVTVTVVSAWLPARRGARVAPMAALRDVAVDTGGRARGRLVAGLVVTAAGLGLLGRGLVAGGSSAAATVGTGAAVTFLGVAVLGPLLAGPVGRLLGWPVAALRGVSGRLARANAVRNPRRTSATAAALMVGVALVGFITIFASSAKASIDRTLDTSFHGDLVIDSGSHLTGGLSPELARRVATLPEVERAVPLRMAAAEVAGEPTRLVAVDPVAGQTIADLDVRAGRLDDLAPGTIAVAQTVADTKGWSVGDTIPVRFASGPQMLRIAATYGNRALAGSYLISQSADEAYEPNPLDAQVFVALRDQVPPAAGRAAVERVTAEYPTAAVQDLTEYKAAQGRPIDQMLSLIYTLLLLAVVIALLGIANTLALSVHERTRELGLLRAVGMSRRQLRSTVRWESVIIALFGTVLGLAVGAAFGWAMVRSLAEQGFTQLRLPLAQLAVVAALAGVAGVVAAALPARRAARLDVLGAIAGE